MESFQRDQREQKIHVCVLLYQRTSKEIKKKKQKSIDIEGIFFY
jgi:hypothetical protein